MLVFPVLKQRFRSVRQGPKLCSRVFKALDKDGQDRVGEWAAMAGSIMRDSSPHVTILRALLTSSMSRQVSVDQVVQEIETSKSPNEILPAPF